MGAPLIHTGDLIDFVSWANLDFARQFCSRDDCIMAAGNHEFEAGHVGEAFEDEMYRNQVSERVQAAFANDIRFSSRLIGGVNFVAIDNGYYRIERWQRNAGNVKSNAAGRSCWRCTRRSIASSSTPSC